MIGNCLLIQPPEGLNGLEAFVRTVIRSGGKATSCAFRTPPISRCCISKVLTDRRQRQSMEDSIYVDLDADGQPSGIEFLNAGDFFAFRERRGGIFVINESDTISQSVAAG